MSARLYLDRLSERDLAVLAETAGGHRRTAEGVARLRAEPARIEELLGRSEVYDALFAPWSMHPFTVASPFLVFSVMIAGAARRLETTPFVREWVGPRQRLPVFDVRPLVELLEDPARRVLLADVLASYTHVASGTIWVRDRRGWSRRRFNELDPVRLAALLDVVPERQRPAIYLRLGDLALFLSGVFPDFAAERLFGQVQIRRVEAALSGVAGSDDEGSEPSGAIGLLERLGTSAYRRALEDLPPPRGDVARALGEVAERFGDARRVLNVLTDTHLFPARDDLFPSL